MSNEKKCPGCGAALDRGLTDANGHRIYVCDSHWTRGDPSSKAEFRESRSCLKRQLARAKGQLDAAEVLQKARESQAEWVGEGKANAYRPPLWDNGDLPPRYLQHGLADFNRHLRATASAFLAVPSCWSLYLWGETGSRKTTFAVALLAALRAEAKVTSRIGCFVPAYDAVSALRDFENYEAKRAVVRWKGTRWLVLDDLGKHRDTPHIIEQLLFLLHIRYDWHEPGQKTIVTSNMNLDRLAKLIDPATARRLEEGMVIELAVPGWQKEQETPT